MCFLNAALLSIYLKKHNLLAPVLRTLGLLVALHCTGRAQAVCAALA